MHPVLETVILLATTETQGSLLHSQGLAGREACHHFLGNPGCDAVPRTKATGLVAPLVGGLQVPHESSVLPEILTLFTPNAEACPPLTSGPPW